MERDQSEFNMAFSYLNRLNNLFYLADNASIDLDPHTWLQTLITIFREISTEMKQEEIEEKTKKMMEINVMVRKTIKDSTRTGRVDMNQELYKELHIFELDLRQVMKQSGLQLKMKEDPRLALGH